MVESTFADNATFSFDGSSAAIEHFGPDLATIRLSTFVRNDAYHVGGAIATGGTMEIDQSSVFDKLVYHAGGAIANFGTLSITDSTFDGRPRDAWSQNNRPGDSLLNH